MENNKLIIKLKNISYLGGFVGNNIAIEVKVRDQIFAFCPQIKLNDTLNLDSEIFNFDFISNKFKENIDIKITEKDFLLDDIGEISQKINIDLSDTKSQEFVFEVNVKEIATNFHKATAIFKITLAFETSSFEQKQIIISKIIEQAKIHEIDPNFAVALAFGESQFNPLAISPTGALSIFQLTGVARTDLKQKFNFPISDLELFDIDKNITGGIIYLAWIWKRYKGKQDQYEKTIAAWNAGRSYISVNGPITFNKIPKPKKRTEAKQLVERVMNEFKKLNE